MLTAPADDLINAAALLDLKVKKKRVRQGGEAESGHRPAAPLRAAAQAAADAAGSGPGGGRVDG